MPDLRRAGPDSLRERSRTARRPGRGLTSP